MFWWWLVEVGYGGFFCVLRWVICIFVVVFCLYDWVVFLVFILCECGYLLGYVNYCFYC